MSEQRAPMDCRSPRCRHLDDGLVNFEHHDRCRIGQPFGYYCLKKEVISFVPLYRTNGSLGPA